MEVEIVTALIVMLTSVTTFLLGLYGAKKFHIGPQQEMLVKTLQDVIEAQEDKITVLEGLVKDQTARIHELEKKIELLHQTIEDCQKKFLSVNQGIIDLTHNQ